MFLMPSHFTQEESINFRCQFLNSAGQLEPEIHGARFILTKVRTVKRAKLDLRNSNVWTEDIEPGNDNDNVLTVINLDWLLESWKAEKLLSIDNFVVYRGRKIAKPSDASYNYQRSLPPGVLPPPQLTQKERLAIRAPVFDERTVRSSQRDGC